MEEYTTEDARPQAGVYLIHFSTPYVGVQRNPDAKKIQTVSHYVGYAQDIQSRFHSHANRTGARLTQVVVDAGIGLELVRVWVGKTRKFEQKLKRQKHSNRFCPVCLRRKEEMAQ